MRTHPLSESRIADTRNRARLYPAVESEPSLAFHLMRARMQVHHADTPQRAVAQFRASLDGQPRSAEADRYGLTMALTESGQPQLAQDELNTLLANNPQRLEYIVAGATLNTSIGEPQLAIVSLQHELKLYPGNHALTMAYARALLMNGQAHIAEQVLLQQSFIRPEDPGLWYLLAEVDGLSGNILGLHQARAEYFILNGIFDEAEKQLDYAMGLAKNNYQASAKISQRLKDVAGMRQRMEF